AHPPAPPLRARRARPPPAARLAVRHRPYRLVPVLLAPRGGGGSSPRGLSAARRLARGLDPRILAGVPRPRRRRARLADPARVSPPPPARPLLLEAARAQASGARPDRRADAPRGP